MSEPSNYWNRRTMSRRAALRGAAAAGGGAVALGLAACSSTKKGASGPAATGTVAAAAIDPTKGKPGGKLVIQAQDDAGTLVLVKTNNPPIHQLASFTHSGLLQFKHGRPGVDGTDISVEPDLAQAMPEQPDDSTYTFKLRQAEFQNGRAVTSQDGKYTFERYASASESAYKSTWGARPRRDPGRPDRGGQ